MVICWVCFVLCRERGCFRFGRQVGRFDQRDADADARDAESVSIDELLWLVAASSRQG
jgi:hypothetical protein